MILRTRHLGILGTVLLLCAPAGCGDDDSGPCGNGVIEISEGEECDGVLLGGASCESLGAGTGTLACDDACIYDTTDCSGGNDCGNGVAESPNEECDDTDLGGATCDSLGLNPGTLVCGNDCMLDTSGCGAVCGNLAVETGEDCDAIDPFDTAGVTCVDQGFAGGELQCDSGCAFDEQDCYNLDLGGPCEADADCPNGWCMTELVYGAAGGYCTEWADANDQCANSGSSGIPVTTGGDYFCLEECDPALDPTSCREGQTCLDIGVGVCIWGGCTDNSQCTTTNFCQTDPLMNSEGSCVVPPQGTPMIGEPCTADADCNGGTCLAEVNPYDYIGVPGGYCREECNPGGNGCEFSSFHGICVSYSDGDTGCLKYCPFDAADPQSTCRDGYYCYDLGNDAGICTWGGEDGCSDNSQCTVTGDCDTDPNSDTVGFCLVGLEDCDNGVDDEGDGLVDCEDPSCAGHCNCPIGEICDDSVDNDGDGLTDCDDGECTDDSACTDLLCEPVTGADLTCASGTLAAQSNDATGSTDLVDAWGCHAQDTIETIRQGSKTGPEYVYTFTTPTSQTVTVDLTITDTECDLDVFVLKASGGECNPWRDCFAVGQAAGAGEDENVVFAAHPGVTYYIAVDGFEASECDFDLTVSCAASGYENCTNGSDDDADGLVDCADPACIRTPDCTSEGNDCHDMVDNDGDGAIDCDDSDCSASADCVTAQGFWESWLPSDNEEVDLAGTTLTFTAAAAAQGYNIASTTSATYIDPPGSGTTTAPLTIADGDVATQALPFGFLFDGTTFNTAYVSENGGIAFAEPTMGLHREPEMCGQNFYSLPIIAPFWTDLVPDLNGMTGVITYDEFADRVVFTWDGLYFSNVGLAPNRIQLAIYANGDIRMTWIAVDSTVNMRLGNNAIVTLVGGITGTPPAESDLSSF